MEKFVRSVWDGEPIAQILMPNSRWEMTYGATFDLASDTVAIAETERMTVYVATEEGDGISMLHPIRIEREHFKVHGKLLQHETPGEPRRVTSHEWVRPVLTEKLR